jgi:dipeptidyl aminopeptidase/acylaminoacyl peptidase
MARPRRLIVAAVLLLVGAAVRLPAQAGPSLEQILSAPFPTELLAAPAGGKLAWTQNTRGVRNVWVAEPPEYRGRQVTRYDKDDGQAVGGLEWAPDAKVLVYVRGSGPNGRGENPNPAGDPAGAEQAVWRVALEGGAPVKIGNGAGAVVSPKGDGVAFVRGGQIWWAPLDGSREPQQWVHARGGARSLRWSPDGSRLAFVSARGDHNFIGIYDLEGKTLRWIAPSVDRDDEPVWSPDGKRLAFLRQPASSKTTTLFYAERSGHPWSILVADAATGEAKTVWTAREGMGSVFSGMVAENQVLWGAGDRLVFPWEGDGWLHLYSVPASPGGATGEATLLTPGDFEIENVILDPDRREVLFNSNQGDLERRHLWRVGVAGGRPVPVTSGKGIEWLPAVIGDRSDGKALAYVRAGARRPTELVIRFGDGPERELVPGGIPADFPEAALVEPEPVVFDSADGMRIHGQLFLPRGLKPGERRPGLLFLHGGSHRQMLLGWHYSPYYNNAYGMNQYLASRGYVVLAVNFRAGTGYGMEFREALNQGAEGASEFYDVLGAGQYLRRRPEVDPDRIGLWGGSYGGFLTAMGLARASHLFKAGVDLHGVHDWNVGIQRFLPDYNPLEHPEQARLAFESSPLAWVDGWRSPVLVIHGDDDRNVDFSQTVRLVEALRERKVEVEQLILPDEVHTLLTWSNWISAYRATADFFDRKLAEKGNRP